MGAMEPTPGKVHPARRARLAAGALSASALVGLTGYLATDHPAPATAAPSAAPVAAPDPRPTTPSTPTTPTTPSTVAPSPRSSSGFSGAIPARPSLRPSTRSRGS